MAHSSTEVLTKENFWNALHEKYPDAMREFCEWIDQYKADVRWLYMFTQKNKGGMTMEVYKYHDIPIAMQVGIFIQFVSERSKYCSFPICDDWKQAITNWFKNRQSHLKENFHK